MEKKKGERGRAVFLFPFSFLLLFLRVFSFSNTRCSIEFQFRGQDVAAEGDHGGPGGVTGEGLCVYGRRGERA